MKQSNGKTFDFADPLEVPKKMQDLMQNLKNSDHHSLIKAAKFHYEFVRIHPFDDGNGRIARLLTNYILMKDDYLPLIILSSDKKNYLDALNQADTGDIDAFYLYLAKQLEESYQKAMKVSKGEDISDPDDLDQAIDIWKRDLLSVKNPLHL